MRDPVADALRQQLNDLINSVPERIRAGSADAAARWKEDAMKALKIVRGSRAKIDDMKSLVSRLQ